MQHKHTNKLINENSPYLLQHAHNPVNWYPYGEEAFERAKKFDLPIFLSSGYSACHWCHVMEKECFEDEEIAKILNDNFVAIKVDRECRPDVDSIYMDAVQLLVGSGGWPLNVFLTSEGKPFYGGTYFPPQDYLGRPGFKTVLNAIIESWQTNRSQLLEACELIEQKLNTFYANPTKGTIEANICKKCIELISQIFDHKYGGFGEAPKFPQTELINFLLEYCFYSNDKSVLKIALQSLNAMSEGGIYDQIGGGFHRYSTDQTWLVPHFEKMLYDQAKLMKTYTIAWQITKSEKYKSVVEDIYQYIIRDMTDSVGGFYSAQDADSEGVEGKFYVWEKQQIYEILEKTEADIFCARFGITDAGNFEENNNILHISISISKLAADFGTSEHKIEEVIKSSKEKLFKIRKNRAMPSLDDKIITSWNGLMIEALAYAGSALQEQKYIDAAKKASDFVITNLTRNGKLLRSYRKGKAQHCGCLEDYAYFIAALIELYQADFDPKWLKPAQDLTEAMLNDFGSNNNDLLYEAANETKDLFARKISTSDGALPSPNATAAMNLLKLGKILFNDDYTKKAAAMLQADASGINSQPIHYPSMLSVLNFLENSPQEIIIVANEKEDAGCKEMIKLLSEKYLPNTVKILISSQNSNDIYQLNNELKDYVSINDKSTAYVCQNFTCRSPVTKAEDLEKLLNSNA